MNLVTAIIVENAVTHARVDEDQALKQKATAEMQELNELKGLFLMMDADGDGHIQFREMHQKLCDENVCSALTKLGVVPHEVLGLFTLMDDGDDEIAFCEFLAGIMRLKAASRGVDLATILYENKKILKRVLTVGQQVEGLKSSLGHK